MGNQSQTGNEQSEERTPEEEGHFIVGGIARAMFNDMRLRVTRKAKGRLVLTMNNVPVGEQDQDATPQTLRAIVYSAVDLQVQAHLDDPYKIACMALVGRKFIGDGRGGRTTLFEVLGEGGLNTKDSGGNIVLVVVKAAIVARIWDFASASLWQSEKPRHRNGGQRHSQPPPALKPAATANATKGGEGPPNGVKAAPSTQA